MIPLYHLTQAHTYTDDELDALVAAQGAYRTLCGLLYGDYRTNEWMTSVQAIRAWVTWARLSNLLDETPARRYVDWLTRVEKFMRREPMAGRPEISREWLSHGLRLKR